MFVHRNKAGWIESVTGSIHQPTLDWLLAEDEWRQEQSGDKKPAARAARQPAKQAQKEPAKQETPATGDAKKPGSDD